MATVTLPVTLTANTNENVADLNANLNAIVAAINGGLDQNNLANGAVTAAKIATLPSARVVRTTAQSVGNGLTPAISFDTESHDSDNIHDAVNPTRLTCRTAGVYTIAASFEFASNATGTREARMIFNGAVAIAVDRRPAVNGVNTGISVAVPAMRLGVGDFVEIFVTQNSGVALNVDLTLMQPNFGMAWIGP